MRLLIACSKCGRQYDATGKRAGGRFRCHCGAVVAIKPPKGHEAKVVVCSSCGAPQEEGRLACNFCAADFTLHERDLHTVCPKCLARISDRARFCHHCGVRVAAESVAGESTRLPCPACGEEHPLSGRSVAGVPVLECDRCAGLWLGNDTFKQLTQRAASQAVNVTDHFPSGKAPPPSHQRGGLTGQRYRKCPTCGDIMYRRNYARRSGVVIDVCRKHGAWFDAEELPRIMAWVRDGGLARARRDVAKEKERKERWEKAMESDNSPRRTSMWIDVEPQPRGAGLADVLVEAMFRFFG